MWRAALSLSLLALCCQLRVASSASALQPSVTAHRASIVCVGDGLTEAAFTEGGWGSRLGEAYWRRADVLNRGFGGYKSSWITWTLPSLFESPNVRLVIIFLGVKDAVNVQGPALVTPGQFRQNVGKILERVAALGNARALIITPAPFCDACAPKSANPYRSSNNTQRYVDELRRLATQHKAGFLDIFSRWRKHPNWAQLYLKPDLLHLTPEGNSRLYLDISNTIAEQLPDLVPGRLPLHWYHSKSVGPDQEQQAFGPVWDADAARAHGPALSGGVQATIRRMASEPEGGRAGAGRAARHVMSDRGRRRHPGHHHRPTVLAA